MGYPRSWFNIIRHDVQRLDAARELYFGILSKLNIIRHFVPFSMLLRVHSDGFNTEQTERPHRPPPKKTSKSSPYKQNIVLVHSTMMVALLK